MPTKLFNDVAQRLKAILGERIFVTYATLAPF